jgi:hypothetical protein
MAHPRRETAISTGNPEEEYCPKTALGRRLWEIRQHALKSGEPLLDWDGLEREIAERRGEQGPHR